MRKMRIAPCFVHFLSPYFLVVFHIFIPIFISLFIEFTIFYVICKNNFMKITIAPPHAPGRIFSA